jgi:ribosome maturation factor RimP
MSSPTTLRLMAALTSSRVRPLLDPVVTAAGYDLEDVVVTAAGRRSVVRVVVDRDGGVDLDAVAEVSRAVSEALDAADSLGASPYVLEVTSPGVDRPLSLPRHWRRNVGRLVRADHLTGRIVEASDDGVTLEVAGEDLVLGYDELGDGHVQVEFSRPRTGESP